MALQRQRYWAIQIIQRFSYGGYRGKTRDLAPTHEQLTEDLKILSAMGVKVLRTYNTSQYPQVASC